MADPFTAAIGAVGIGGSLFGAATSAAGAQNQAQSTQQMYNYQAGVSAVNAQIAQQNANWALATGEQSAAQQGMQWRSQIGKATAAFGASNLNVNTGSAAQVISSMHELSSNSQTATRSSADQRAYGFEVQGAEDTAQSQLDLQAGSNAIKAGQYNVASTIIGGATSVASKWFQASQSGTFSGASNMFATGVPNGSWGINF